MTISPTPAPADADFAAIVVAAGQGRRAGQPVPKQFAPWRGKPLVRHSVETLAAAGAAPILVMIPEGAQDIASEALAGIAHVALLPGGETRQQSVRLGLEALEKYGPERVFIHDAARPVLPRPVIARLSSALEMHGAAIPVLPVVDSLAHAAPGGVMGASARREDLRRVQTPQAFRFAEVLAAHLAWNTAADAGDDAQVARAAGMEVAMVEGDEALHKVTFPTDFMADRAAIRVGTGYDVHRLEPGEELWLCGIRVPHEFGLSGHSDADVAIHALVDAMLGAIGAGDIGKHFPPSDERWRGASSDRFLLHAADLMREAGYRLANADLTILCEAPKIGPHRETMRARLAEILGVEPSFVSVKATTTEGLGFTGRREGIAVQAAVCLAAI
jgi:2-C-methyl-D-erythritol 4-phosphate cytidylyltransferase / 2-C-methyl-D-erythritol 2,4-cyclodiphosphate synthase